MNERFKFPADREARNAARTKALESLLIEKGVITGETVDKVLGVFETKMGIVMERQANPVTHFDGSHTPQKTCGGAGQQLSDGFAKAPESIRRNCPPPT